MLLVQSEWPNESQLDRPINGLDGVMGFRRSVEGDSRMRVVKCLYVGNLRGLSIFFYYFVC